MFFTLVYHFKTENHLQYYLITTLLYYFLWQVCWRNSTSHFFKSMICSSVPQYLQLNNYSETAEIELCLKGQNTK